MEVKKIIKNIKNLKLHQNNNVKTVTPQNENNPHHNHHHLRPVHHLLPVAHLHNLKNHKVLKSQNKRKNNVNQEEMIKRRFNKNNCKNRHKRGAMSVNVVETKKW